MRTLGTNTRQRSAVARLGVLLVALAMLGLVGCASGDDGGDTQTTSSETTAANGSSEQTTTTEPAADAGTLTVIPPAACGDPVLYERSGAEAELLETLPAEVRDWYGQYPWAVKETPWQTFEGKEGPWEIGYISFPLANPWKINYYEQLQEDFDAALSAGVVSGELRTFIQPDFETATPEQQAQAIQQMVDEGVDGIILHPLSAEAVTPAIDAAGEAGVPVVLQADVAPDSVYSINNWTAVNAAGQADFLAMLHDKGWFQGEPRTTIVIRGIAGSSIEQAIHDSAIAEMAACPGIDVLGTLFTNWNNVTTKEELLTFLASHPEEIDFIMNEDAVGAGVIQAFEEAGRPVPPQPLNQSSGGDYSWWLANADTYETLGHSYAGAMAAYTDIRLLLRVLDGRGLKIRDISPTAEVVTNANIADYAEPGLAVTDQGDLLGPVDGWLSDSEMDMFFEEPGTPGGL